MRLSSLSIALAALVVASVAFAAKPQTGTADIQQLGGSGISGTADFRLESNGNARVHESLSGLTPGAQYTSVVFLNTTQHDPQDWDIALSVQYKNFAALDGLTAKQEAMRDKVLGSKQAAQQLGEKRVEMREIVSTMLLREVTLK